MEEEISLKLRSRICAASPGIKQENKGWIV
jgi:hypothetical protein